MNMFSTFNTSTSGTVAESNLSSLCCSFVILLLLAVFNILTPEATCFGSVVHVVILAISKKLVCLDNHQHLLEKYPFLQYLIHKIKMYKANLRTVQVN